MGSHVFLNLACLTEQFSETTAIRSQPLPAAFSASSGAFAVSGCEFILYMGLFEALRAITISRERLGLLNWIYWEFYFFLPSRIP